MAAVNSLPVEIWRRILQYVSGNQTATLYAVNHILFDIVMARRYEEVSFGYNHRPKGRSDEADIHALKSPCLSRHVRSLKLRIDASERFRGMNLHKRSLLRRESFQLKRRVGVNTAANTPPALEFTQVVVQELLDFFAIPRDFSDQLPALQKLAVSSEDRASQFHRHYHELQPILGAPLRNAMQSISANLLSLQLHIPLEYYRDNIFSCSVSFVQLEELSMQLFAIYNTTDHEDVFETRIAPFVNRHSQSLTKLHFSSTMGLVYFPHYFYKYARLFRDITHIPGLSDFSADFLSLPCSQDSVDELGGFIYRHASSLSTLSLHLYHSPDKYQHQIIHRRASTPDFRRLCRVYTPNTLMCCDLFSKALPMCASLKDFHCMLMSPSSFQLDPDPFLSWFPTLKSAATLTTLHLPYNWFNQLDLIKLVSSVELSSLQSLWFRSQSLSMALFDVFSRKLGSLRVLRLRTCGVSTRENLYDIIVPRGLLPANSPFLMELEASRYPAWKTLTDLHLILQDEAALERRYAQECVFSGVWLTKEQVAQTFPQLQTFNARINFL